MGLCNSKQNEVKQDHTKIVREDYSDREQAKMVIQCYRDSKVVRKVQKLNPEVKSSFASQFPKFKEQGTSSLQHKDTYLVSQRTPQEESECNFEDLEFRSYTDGHVNEIK